MREPDPVTPLWRAAQVFRLLSCIYALGFQIAINPDLDHPAIGWLLFAVLIGWSVACAVAYLQGFGRRPAWVIAEIVVVVALVLSTEFVASDAVGAGQPVMADDVVGHQRNDLRGDPDGSDPRHARRCGGDDREHGREGLHQLRPRPQRHDRHRAGGRPRGGHGSADRQARPRRTGTRDQACGVAGRT